MVHAKKVATFRGGDDISEVFMFADTHNINRRSFYRLEYAVELSKRHMLKIATIGLAQAHGPIVCETKLRRAGRSESSEQGDQFRGGCS